MRVGELRFQILDASLQRSALRRSKRIAAAIAWCRRRHPASPDAGDRWMPPRCRRARHPSADELRSSLRIDSVRQSSSAPGNAQHRAAAQNIDVAAEGIGIRAIHGDHGLIDVARRDSARKLCAILVSVSPLSDAIACRQLTGAAPPSSASVASAAGARSRSAPCTRRCGRDEAGGEVPGNGTAVGFACVVLGKRSRSDRGGFAYRRGRADRRWCSHGRGHGRRAAGRLAGRIYRRVEQYACIRA